MNFSAVVTGATALTSCFPGRVRRPSGAGKGGDGAPKAAQLDCRLRRETERARPAKMAVRNSAFCDLLFRYVESGVAGTAVVSSPRRRPSWRGGNHVVLATELALNGVSRLGLRL